jgi:hypothetical protein
MRIDAGKKQRFYNWERMLSKGVMEYVRQIAGKYHILLRERYDRKIILIHHIFHHYNSLSDLIFENSNTCVNCTVQLIS